MANGDTGDRIVDSGSERQADAAEEKARAEALEDRAVLTTLQRQQGADVSKDFGDVSLVSAKDSAQAAGIDRDGQGRVSEVRYPDGSTKQFEYGADEKVNRVTDENGWSWRRDAQGWHLYDSHGKQTVDEQGKPTRLEGDISVDQQGNFIFTHNNGMKEISGPSGSYIRQEPNGDVSRVTYPDGTRKEFTYGQGSRLDAYTDQNGWSWRRDTDGWHLYDDQGQRKPDTLQGDIEVDRQGNFTFVHRDGTREVTRPDGSVQRMPAPGAGTRR